MASSVVTIFPFWSSAATMTELRVLPAVVAGRLLNEDQMRGDAGGNDGVNREGIGRGAGEAVRGVGNL